MGYGYKIIFTFYELGFPSAHLDRPGLGQGFKGCRIQVLPDAGTIPLIRLAWNFSIQNVEP
jgi:hypothetical protein